MILGIDPGTECCGVVVYDEAAQRVVYSDARTPVERALELITSRGLPVAIERMQSIGISGASLLRTCEVVGRLWQRADDRGLPVELVYRREVLRHLDVTGSGNRDSLVRARLIEMHGGSREAAVGRKASPGPLYGVGSHAWAALGVAVTAAERLRHGR